MKLNSYDLIDKAQKGDDDARKIIVETNIPLVWSLVHRFTLANQDKEDLFQIGCLGLLKAIDKFDTSYGVQFSTYAVPIILGEIKKHFRDDGSVKVSRGLKELNIKINKAREELYKKYHQEATIDDIATYLQTDKESIVLAMEANYYPMSLSETIYEKDGSSLNLEDRLYEDDSNKMISILTLKESLSNLSEQDQLLIYLRYYCDLNQDVIAKKFNVSQVQISRLEKKIIEKLRKQFV